MPSAFLGIAGPMFALTFKGKCLGRSVTSAIENAFDLEYTHHLAIQPAYPLKDLFYIKPEMIRCHIYLMQFLEGKTKTHTSTIHTDAEYR